MVVFVSIKGLTNSMVIDMDGVSYTGMYGISSAVGVCSGLVRSPVVTCSVMISPRGVAVYGSLDGSMKLDAPLCTRMLDVLEFVSLSSSMFVLSCRDM